MHISRHTIFLVGLALPWLNPFDGGPSPAVVPWLVSLACVGGLVAAMPLAQLSKRFAWGLTIVGIYFIVSWALGGFRNTVEVLATMLALLCAALCMMVGRGLLGHPDSLRWFSGTWLVVALISAVMALFQYFGIENWFSPWISPSYDGMAFANLRQRNQFASLTGIGMLALMFVVTDRPSAALATGARESLPLVVLRLWPWAAMLLLATANAATASRTGIVQWILLAFLALCWRSSLAASVRKLFLYMLPVYAVVAMVLPPLVVWADKARGIVLAGEGSGNVFTRIDDATGGGRVALYSNVWDLIAQNPWWGWGWRELAYTHYTHTFDQRFPEILDNAHNLPLHLAVELGLPCAVLVCGALLWWLLTSRPWREALAHRQLAWGVLLLIGLHSMTEYPLWYGPFLITAGLAAGLLCTHTKEHIKPHVAAVYAIPMAGFLILCTAFLAWDYHRVSQIYLTEQERTPVYARNTLAQAQSSVLFARQARFAELVTTVVTPQTAPRVLSLAADLVHYSPEPRVIQALIESATALHLDDVAIFHLARYKEVFPKEYAAWSAVK